MSPVCLTLQYRAIAVFFLETRNFKLTLEVVPVDALLQHEETLSKPGKKLILALKNQAHLHNPIIIDENGVVLDGNHRALAFKTLKFKHIAACRIDYFQAGIKLRYWHRHLLNVPGLDRVKRLVQELNGSWQEADDKDCLKEFLEKDRFSCGLQQGDFFAWIHFPDNVVSDAVTAYAVFNRIQEKLLKEGCTLEYIPCSHAREKKSCSDIGEDELVLWSPRITKEMVVAAAKEQKVFTPKATRHLIPARPLNVDVPTEWFREDVSLEAINRRFEAHLKEKKIQRLGPGQIINGRYYEEELFVFFD